MEQACYRCGGAVEEGTAFCPHCNAPQIRVEVPETPAAADTTGVILPPAVGSSSFAVSPTSLQWQHGLPAAAIGGVLAALTLATPLGIIGIGPVIAGVVAIVLYRRRVPFCLLTPGVGAKLGALAGSLGFAIYGLFFLAVLRASPELHSALLEALDKAASRNPDPQVQRWVEYFKTPDGLAVITAMGLGVIFLIALLFSSLGGVMGARWLRRRNHL